MKIAILDPHAGISGDMTLGALVACGVDPTWLRSLPERLGYKNVEVSIRDVVRCGITAVKVDFSVEGQMADGHHHGQHVPQLIGQIQQASVSPSVRATASRAFELIGAAEARVHGVSADRVHLHEVGAIDAILDIVGVIEGFELLGAEAIYHLPPALGGGWVNAAHGTIPIPAPATAVLLEGMEVSSDGPAEGEATTPTGAALIRVLSRGSPPGTWRIVSSGWGAGGRNPASYPNALRLIIGEHAEEAAFVEVLATDIDDMSPEYIEPLRVAIFEAGAVDCMVWPTQGKKGRVGFHLEALAGSDTVEAVKKAILAHSTTAGVRSWPAKRNTLPRNELRVEMAHGATIRVKILGPSSNQRLKPEYEDVVMVAKDLQKPALEVAETARALARKQLDQTEPATVTNTATESSER